MGHRHEEANAAVASDKELIFKLVQDGVGFQELNIRQAVRCLGHSSLRMKSYVAAVFMKAELAKNTWRGSALTVALPLARCGLDAQIKFLISDEVSTDLDVDCPVVRVDPLMFAVREGNLEAVKLLVSAGAV